MLLIESYLDNSSGRGFGLFASAYIKKNTVFWVRNELFDKIITNKEFFKLNQISKKYVERYACLEKSGNWYLCSDNSRFSNHSFKNNTINVFDNMGILQKQFASKDIKAGEEILCDYTELCLTCKNGLNFNLINF